MTSRDARWGPRKMLALRLFALRLFALRMFALCMFAAVAFGCATLAKAPASAPPPPAAKATAPAAAPQNSASAARSDSLPSPDAELVLASIPEPLSAAQQVAPDSTKRRSFSAPEAGHDTLRVQPQDGETANVPVPSPMPVTAAPVVSFAPPESTARVVPLASAPSASAPPAAPPATSAPATSAPMTAAPAAPSAAAATTATGTTPPPPQGPCWHVQVAAPATREEAESRLEVAQSLLVVKMAIVPEKGLYKVRTSDCMTREVADSVKRRALDSGFDGSFLVDTSVATKPAAVKQKPKSAGNR